MYIILSPFPNYKYLKIYISQSSYTATKPTHTSIRASNIRIMASISPSPTITITDTYQIKCAANPLAPRVIQFTPWELSLLNIQYIQKGILFAKPSHLSFRQIFDLLRDSLEETLYHFYPFSGRLKVTCDGEATIVELEIVPGSDGAEIVRAVAERITIADVASYHGRDSPEVLKLLFPFDEAVSFDGCCKPLLSVQVYICEKNIYLFFFFFLKIVLQCTYN